jgi:6-pyruvoyltetrahydropterin/6-carboxytetrahydropterin synthase
LPPPFTLDSERWRGDDMKVFTEFTFEAAHFLPNVPTSHPCRKMHGHHYRVRVEIAGPVGEASGWVVDYAVVELVCSPEIRQLDHSTLNDVIDNPTCERICEWLWEKWQAVLDPAARLSRIAIWETPTSGCVYEGS